MDQQQEIFFKALTDNTISIADALDDPSVLGFKDGVVNKYSDKAHFIYEILQNAEDAKATSVRFVLLSDKLVFAHNGTRRFTVSDPATFTEDKMQGKLGDINSIVAVGGSNKTGKETIGRFGLGFKAVFQYTSTPHIYDPNVFFKIDRFLVPIRVYEDFPDRRNGETLFVFPFNHKERTPEEAYDDISRKLRSLDYPLLFLSNLKNIEYEISGRRGHYRKIVEEKLDFDGTTAEYIRLTQNNIKDPEALDNTNLWLFTRHDGDYQHAIGYFINTSGQLAPKKLNAFCYFLTKEATGLNFIIHAPFQLNDSREGIQAGVPHNIHMISLLSNLAADSFIYLRDIGLLQSKQLINDNIIDVIPYDDSIFSDIDSVAVGDPLSRAPPHRLRASGITAHGSSIGSNVITLIRIWVH